MEEKLKNQANFLIDNELMEEKEKLKERLSKLMGNSKETYKYKKRLDKIFKILNDKLMYEGKYQKIFRNADFYQKLELFMDYEKDDEGNIVTDIDKVIGEVFKSLYINFILSFLEREERFPLPYFGELKIKEIDRFNPLFSRNIHYFYGRMYLDKALRKDLQKIDKEEKIDIIDNVLTQTKKALVEKMF